MDFASIVEAVRAIIQYYIDSDKAREVIDGWVAFFNSTPEQINKAQLYADTAIYLLSIFAAASIFYYITHRIKQIVKEAGQLVENLAVGVLKTLNSTIKRDSENFDGIFNPNTWASAYGRYARFVTGTSKEGMAKCASCASVRHLVAGATLIAPIFAALAFAAAISMSGVPWYAVIGIAAAYGLMIFIFDAVMIVSKGHFTTKKRDDGRATVHHWANYAVAAVFVFRAAFILMIAIAAATPVELIMFRAEVDEQIMRHREHVAKLEREALNAEAAAGGGIARLRSELLAAQEAVARLDQEIERRSADIAQIAAGAPPSCADKETFHAEMRKQETCMDPSTGLRIRFCDPGQGDAYLAAQEAFQDAVRRCDAETTRFQSRADARAELARSDKERLETRRDVLIEERARARTALAEAEAAGAVDGLDDRPAGLIEQIAALNAIYDPSTTPWASPVPDGDPEGGGASDDRTLMAAVSEHGVPPIGISIIAVMFIILMAIEMIPLLVKLTRAINPGCWETGSDTPCGDPCRSADHRQNV